MFAEPFVVLFENLLKLEHTLSNRAVHAFLQTSVVALT
jgi:hypothetical protein